MQFEYLFVTMMMIYTEEIIRIINRSFINIKLKLKYLFTCLILYEFFFNEL